jgi:undecaprenyl-diphosphatase
MPSQRPEVPRRGGRRREDGNTVNRQAGIAQLPRRLTSWFGGQEPVVLLGLLTVVATTWGFIELAAEVVAGDTEAFDHWAVRAVRQTDDPAVPIGPHWLPEVGRDATALGSIAVLSFFTLVVAGYLWLDRKFWMMLYLLVATVSGLVVSLGLKQLYDRPRQDLVPRLSEALTTSFPSGHSFLSTVVYLTLGSLLATVIPRTAVKIYVLAIAVVLAVIVGLSRLYLGMHYPTDILAGWMAGLGWALLCWMIAHWLQRHHRLETADRDVAQPEATGGAAEQ